MDRLVRAGVCDRRNVHRGHVNFVRSRYLPVVDREAHPVTACDVYREGRRRSVRVE